MDNQTHDMFTLHNTDRRNVRFEGEKIAEVSNHSYQGPRQNRWRELDLYRTTKGTFVLHDISRTRWMGEEDCHNVITYASEADLIEAIGDSELGKELLEEARIDHAQDIE